MPAANSHPRLIGMVFADPLFIVTDRAPFASLKYWRACRDGHFDGIPRRQHMPSEFFEDAAMSIGAILDAAIAHVDQTPTRKPTPIAKGIPLLGPIKRAK
jgi:hypothetical protein